MRTPLILVGFLGAGVVGALAGQVLFTPEPPPASSSPDVARLERRIEDLESEGAAMSEEIRRLSVPAPAPRTLAAVPARSADADIPSPEPVTPPDMQPTAASPGMVPEERIEEKVVETVRKIARAEREKKERWAAAKQAEKEEKWLAGMKERLGLTDVQVDELKAMLATRRRAIAGYKRVQAEQGPDASPEARAALDQRMKAFGQTQDQELRRVLSTEQYETLMQSRKPAGR